MRKKFLSIPYVIWMAFFVVIPLILIVIYAFTAPDGSFSTESISGLGSYANVFGRSLLLAFIATVISLIIGYPFAYILSRESAAMQRISSASPAKRPG